jgi:hypothetical protein
VARAKRTDRADARRRYRAQLAEATEGDAAESTEGATVEPARRTRPSAPAQPPARPSITYAFRTAFRPANVREDLAYLPTLVLRTKAVWLPALLAIAAGVLVVVNPNELTGIAFQYLVYTPPVGALFLAGFLAPRASYLAGILVAAIAAVVFAAVVPTGAVERALRIATDLDQPGIQAAVLVQGVTVGAGLGAIVAASAAWYKRFLALANPNRGRRPQPRGKPARARR